MIDAAIGRFPFGSGRQCELIVTKSRQSTSDAIQLESRCDRLGPPKNVEQGQTLSNGAIINVSSPMSIENGPLFGLSLPNSGVLIHGNPRRPTHREVLKRAFSSSRFAV